MSQGEEGLFATHVPLALERADGGERLVGHVARANPHWRSFDGEREALAIFHGPHAYVSPSWYATAPAVPTWNYAVVHVYGSPRVVDDRGRLRAILERLTAQYEPPEVGAWSPSGLPREYAERVLQAIVGFEMPVARIEAKRKLGQGRSQDDLRGVVEHLDAQPDSDARGVAALMREVCLK